MIIRYLDPCGSTATSSTNNDKSTENKWAVEMLLPKNACMFKLQRRVLNGRPNLDSLVKHRYGFCGAASYLRLTTYKSLGTTNCWKLLLTMGPPSTNTVDTKLLHNLSNYFVLPYFPGYEILRVMRNLWYPQYPLPEAMRC